MNENEYLILDDFQINNLRGLILDGVGENLQPAGFMIDDKYYSCTLDYGLKCVFVENTGNECFIGKKISFVAKSEDEK